MKYTKENLESIVNKSNTISEVLNYLSLKQCGGSHTHISKLIKKFEISTKHFDIKKIYKKRRLANTFTKDKFINNVLTISGSNWQSHKIKLKLFEFDLKERKCEICGQNEIWFTQKLSLQLHHINGNRRDNRIMNLMVLCPNCHSQTTSFSKNKMIKKRKPVPILAKGKKINYCNCGKQIKNKSKMCTKCYSIKQRLVERPSKELLQNEINKFGYSATGRKYGVSDNAIRKWIKI